jgi:hypothetical protein
MGEQPVHGATIRLYYTTQSRAIDEHFRPNMRVNTRYAHALHKATYNEQVRCSQDLFNACWCQWREILLVLSHLKVSIDGSRGLFRS